MKKCQRGPVFSQAPDALPWKKITNHPNEIPIPIPMKSQWKAKLTLMQIKERIGGKGACAGNKTGSSAWLDRRYLTLRMHTVRRRERPQNTFPISHGTQSEFHHLRRPTFSSWVKDARLQIIEDARLWFMINVYVSERDPNISVDERVDNDSKTRVFNKLKTRVSESRCLRTYLERKMNYVDGRNQLNYN